MNSQKSTNQTKWHSGLPTMPALFLGHGSPMNAIEENQFVEGFRNIAALLPRPRAILSISAHWYIDGTKATAMTNPRTIYDFYGFPEQLYEIKYPAPGSPELAEEIISLLAPLIVQPDESWGLDHGTWSVVKHLYPNADIPVVQLSIDRNKPAEFHFDLGQKLTALRENGILIIGSGNLIHNLRLVDFRNFDKDDYGYDWAREAQKILNELLTDRNFTRLIDYQNLGEAVMKAVPTPDHYLPFLYILGLAGADEQITIYNDKLVAGSLSMTSIIVK